MRPPSTDPPANQQADRAGVLLVGHGTRSRQGIDEFQALARLVRERLAPLPVEPAFLEMCQPTIADGIARLVERDVQHVVVMPLLLFAAGHVKQDIPRAVAAALDERNAPTIAVTMAGHLGCHPSIVELSTLRFTQSLQGLPAALRDQTALLLVGRGSHDQSAIDEMYRFADLRAQRSAVAITEVAFLAMAEPKVPAVLTRLAEAGFRRIVVQPHLLFHGDLVDRLQELVGVRQQAHAGTEWTLCSHLASGIDRGDSQDELLLQAVADRISAASIHVVEAISGR